jgi:AraC-like DNA-binding protein
MASRPSTSTRGILNPAAASTNFTLARHEPCPELAALVERYWIVRWDLRGREPYVSETLPHPCVNAVFEPGAALAWGVHNYKFERKLVGVGQVFGIKFRPGGFRPFFGRPVAELTDRSMPLHEIFGADTEQLGTAVLASKVDREQVALVETFLCRRLPARDPGVDAAANAVRTVLENASVCTVEDLVERVGSSQRSLQRLFRNYVGVSPKWVIRRHRLQQAAERAAQGRRVDWAALAVELGYFDQSHLIKEFRRQLGCSPAEYAAACRQARASSRGSTDSNVARVVQSRAR